jgi:DNA-directed RNA polymerase subunit M/transcription elongation factor TFIIS
MLDPSETRSKAVERLENVVRDRSVARALEKYAWNFTIQWREKAGKKACWDENMIRWRYTQKVLQLEHNAKTSDLVERIFRGEIVTKWNSTTDRTHASLRDVLESKRVWASPKLIRDILPWDLRPELWKDAFDEARKIAMRRGPTEDHKRAMDGVLICGKCKSKRTEYYLLQTRASDEPMTCYAHCLQCDHRWRQ